MTNPNVSDPMILHQEDIDLVDRGAGVKTTPLVGKWNAQGNDLTTGVTAFEPGTAIAEHTHNCEETVMVLAGEATVVIDGKKYDVKAGDVTWVPKDVPHFFANRGNGEMRIYWVYAGRVVTRTISATGETVEHLSERDRVGTKTDTA
jgi:quercetin dioxygenase-like cupin family protein